MCFCFSFLSVTELTFGRGCFLFFFDLNGSVEDSFADLSIGEDKEASLLVGTDDPGRGISYEHCFVGSFLTSSVVHFQAMHSTLANVWHPIRGIAIFDLGEGCYLFRLFHAVDVDRIEVRGPWNFNSQLLHRLTNGDDLMGSAFVLGEFQGFSV